MPNNCGLRARGFRKRVVVLIATVAMLSTLLSVALPTAAFAAGTLLFQNAFNDRTVDGTGTVTVPTPISGPNQACLTASGNSATQPLLSCAGATDAQGSGKLRLTNSITNQVGAVYGSTSFPTSNGLDVTFNSYQWGGGSADGITFALGAVDPANPVAPTAVGPSGGALGYSAAPGLSGLANAYLGVGLDVFGNFSNSSYSGTGCPGNIPNFGVAVPGAVAVRGPGNVRVGYCGLTTTWDGTTGSKVTLHAATRAAAAVPVQVIINPTASPFTSDTGVIAAAGTYKVVVTPIGQTARTLTGTLPSVTAGLYPSTSWLNANGVPKQLAFGFVGSTGSVTDVHEVSDVKVLTFNPVPQLAVAATSYSAASTPAGGPVNYTVTARVLAGADETTPISVTQTVPTGVVPVGAFGTGWACLAPVGQVVTCTTTASSFTNGTTLPVINVVGTVTATTVSASTIQSASSSRVSSGDANPGTLSIMTAGTVPPAPTSLSVSPSLGLIAGGGVVTVQATTSNVTPTAIEIGTTAEQQAGTSVVLLPCASGRAAGCFNNEGTTLYIQSMPARAAGAAPVTVTVVTLGVATGVSYVYADKPATPATPTATAGITSATVVWVAPASNGGDLTGYVVTPYLAGVAQTTVSYDATATTRTLTGLTAGGSYTFTVSAVNANGTSAASAKSTAVTPYALPFAPTVTTVTTGTLSATLSWTAPGNNGSPITAYVVTPYLGLVAQPAQTFGAAATTQIVTGLTAGQAYTFTVAATNLAGTGPASAKSASVTPNLAPSLAFAALASGEVGVPYSRSLAVTNGTSPFAWSITSGTLPAGLTLAAASGLLSGTPTAAGSAALVVGITDASGYTATEAATLVIAAAPGLTFSPAQGELTVAYSQQPVLTGGTAPITWSISGGALPAGLSINAGTGLISGTPTASGTFAVTVAARDAFNQVANVAVTIVIAALPTLTFADPAAGQVGVPYSTALTASGGIGPFTWSIAAGSLPAGLSLNTTTGVLSGTPTTVGSSSFTVGLVDANLKATSRAVTLVIGAGPLVIVKTANVSSSTAGSVVGYTITVTNTGSTAFTGVNLTDPLTGVLDDAALNATRSATTGTLGYTAPNLTWSGDIGANGSVTISYSVTIGNPDTGNQVLTNTVTSTTLGTNCRSGSGDPRCAATVTVAGLTITKTADVATITPGGTVHFSIVVTNAGQTPYAAATLTDSLAGLLDDATYTADAVATSGNLSYTNPALTWTGSLAVGASATITYSAIVANPDTGNRTLTGTVVSAAAGSTCPAGTPAPSCSATVTVLVPALVISNTTTPGSTTPGSTLPYTVTLANTGQTAYTATTLTLALTGVVDDATYNNNFAASSGVVAYSAIDAQLVWTGDVPLGGVVTITGSFTVRNPDPGNRTLISVASSSAPGSTCPAASSNPACTSSTQVLVPALTISKAADVSSTTPGSVVHYTATVTNTGQTSYAAATFTDTLTDVLDDASYNGNVAATTGTASFTSPALTWTGPLAVGASVTVTYSVTVSTVNTRGRSLIAVIGSTTPGNNCAAGTTDTRCSSTVPVLIPLMNFAISSTATSTTPGSVVQYTLTVTNDGQTAYTGAAVTLSLDGLIDDATYNYDAATTAGSLVTNVDGTVDWVLNLAIGASESGTLSFTVNSPDAGDHSLKFIAVSNAPGSACPTGSSAPACLSTIGVFVPGLVITKTADVSTITPGGTVNYTILVHNTGETAYTAASVTDSLAAVLTDATYGGGASATAGTMSYTAPTLSWTGPLALGATVTISYAVVVRDPDPGDKVMTNTVISASAGSNCAAGSVDVRCTARVSVLVPVLTIVKTANPATTIPGATVGYTIVVTNSGATAYPAAAFTDSLAGVLDDAAYNANAAATSGTVSYASPTVSWVGALAIGATATITYSVTVHAADGGDNLLANTAISTNAGNNCASGSTDTRCTVTVPVARLIITTAFAETSTTPGSVLHMTASYTNTGQVPYTEISIASPRSDVLDDADLNGDQTVSSGTLVFADTVITWTGSIPVGGVVTVVRSLTVKNPDNGNHVVTATLVSAAPGNNCQAGTLDARCKFSATVLTPALTISKSADAGFVVPGGKVGYTITVHDTGQTPYTGATVTDSLGGVLDHATYGADATASSGVVSYTGPTISWTGNLAVGATATITYTMTANDPATGDKTMINQVVSNDVGSDCPPSSGNPACRSTVAVLTPALTIVSTAGAPSATLGSTVAYTITITNSGQTYYPAAQFTDSLTDVTDDATYNPVSLTSSGGGTAGVSGAVLTWSGALIPGNSATVGFTVTINNPSSGSRSLVDQVVSTAGGSNCAAGSGDARCSATVTVVNSTSLVFVKTAGKATAVGGDVVGFTVTAYNASPASISSVNFTDPLAGAVDDAAYDGDAAASSGTVTYSAPTLSWSGDIPAGGTITVTYSVTVSSAGTGDHVLSGTVSSTSVPASDNCVAGSTDPRCAAPVRVAQLIIAQSYTEATTTPGSVVHLSATFHNTGQVAYQGITISSPSAGTVDDAIPTGDQSATSGTLVLGATAITWSGAIPIGATITVTGTLTVRNPDTGDKLITGTLVSAAPGNNCPAGGTDARCTALSTVLLPGLTISRTASIPAVAPGGVVQYSLTFTNNGQTPQSGIAVTDSLANVLDDATYNGDAAVSGAGSVSFSSPVVTWTGTLAVGASATVSYSVTTLNPAPGDKTMINIAASAAVGSNCPPAGGPAACSSVVAVLTPALTIVKTANVATATLGGTVSYTTTVTNTGQTPYAAAAFTDDLADVVDIATYHGAAASTGTLGFSANVLSWTGALAPGASATITYTITVHGTATADTTMSDTAVSSDAGNNCSATSTDPRCTVLIAVTNAFGLTVTKTADVLTTVPGGVVHYTLTVVNTGGLDEPVTLDDPLTAVLDDAVYNTDAVATSGTPVFGSSHVTWSGTVPANGTVTVTYSVAVNSAITGDQILSGTVVSTSNTGSDNCLSLSTDPRCATTVPIARLLLSYGPDQTTTPGSIVTFVATYTNTGQVPYFGISVNVLAPSAADDGLPGEQTASSGTLVLGVNGITWVGDIPVGGHVDLSATMGVRNPDTGDKTITATMNSLAPGSNCAIGSADAGCAVTITVLVPGLTITKVANTTAVIPGGTVGYTITVTDTGQTAYVGAVVTDSLVGILDDATYAGDAAATVGTMTLVGSTLTWTGDLAVSGVAVITYSATVHSPDTGDKTMINPISSSAVGSSCPPAGGGASCRSTVLVLTPGLTIVKTADTAGATLGSTVTYTVTVTNSGQIPYAAAAFTDSLAGVIDDATVDTAGATASSGTLGYAAPVLSWTGALNPGVSATITYTATVNSTSTGDGSMANTATSSTAGNNCPTGTTDTRCTATVGVINSPTLTFAKTADAGSTVPGAVVKYTVLVTNSSTAPVAAVHFTDALAGVLDDASYDANAAASSGSASFTAPNLSWTGTVPAGQTITVSYSVTVKTADVGNNLLAGSVSSDSAPGSNNCASGSTDPHCASTVPVARLILEYGPDQTTTPGSVVNFTATYTNTGQVPYVGISVVASAPGALDDGLPGTQSASSGSLALGATGITWTGDIPVGGVVTLTAAMGVQNPDLGDKIIIATMDSTAPGNNCPSGNSDERCSVRIDVLVPQLTITKSASVTSVIAGQTAGYTITITNTGQTPYTGAVITDTLVGVLDDASYNSDAVASRGTMSFASPVLTWTGDLATTQVATITYSATVLQAGTGDKAMVNRVSSGAVGSTCTTGNGNAACSSTVSVLTPALTIVSSASVASAVPGGTVSYTVTVTNDGQTAYPAATVSIPLAGLLDDASYPGDASATTGSVGLAGQTLTWTGVLAIGDSSTISYSVTVNTPDAGDHRLAQTLTSGSLGSSCPSAGTDPRCTTSVPIAGLSIIDAADVSTTKPTGVVHYTGTFANTGQVPYVGISVRVSFVGALDDAVPNGDSAASAGSLILDVATASIIWTGDVAVGATVTITGSVTVKNPDTIGDKVLTTVASTAAAASNCAVGSTDPLCSNSVQVLIPALTIGVAANTTFTTPGSIVGYTIVITNTGPTAYTAAVVSDPLGGVLNDSTYNADATTTAGGLTFDAGVLTWTGDLALNAVVTITFSVTVDNPDLGDKLMVNQVISTELGSTCPATGGTGCTSVVFVQIPALTIGITADSTTTTPGTAVGYTVTVTNAGQTAYAGATVAVALAGVLDDAGYSGGGSATVGVVSFGSSTLTWTGDLAVGASTVITYHVTVSDPDTGNQLLSTSVSSAAPGSTCTVGAPCTNTVTVQIPGLSVVTAASVATATPGDPVTFTITVHNTGQTAYVGTVVTGTLADILDDASFDGAVTATGGVVTYTNPSISWTGSLLVDASVTISLTVTIANPDTGNKSLTMTALAPAAGSTCRSGSVDPACTATVTVLVPVLTISKSANTPTTTPGSVVHYTIVLTNSGQTPYTGAVVTDSLSGVFPDSTYNGDAVVGSGTLDYAAPTLTWTGDLAVRATTTITYSITVLDPDPGDKAMTNAVSSLVSGSSCPPGSTAPACSTLVQVLVPQMVITKSADTATVTAGNAVQYTITVVNTGESAYAPAVVSDDLTGLLDDASFDVGQAHATVGTLSYVNKVLVWSGALDVGETATVTYSVTTTFPATGDKSLLNTAVSSSAGSNCLTNSTDPRCSATATVLVPALDVSKSVDTNEIVAGGVVHYTLTAKNTGQSGYTAATLTDSLAGMLNNAAYNNDATATSGQISYDTGVLGWTGALAIAQTVTISYSVAVNFQIPDGAALDNRVVSDSVGSSCRAASPNSGCVTSTTIDARSVTLTGLTPSFTLSGPPGTLVSANGAVEMRVTTNSPGGFVVTVQPEGASLVGTGNNHETIPVERLGVRESGKSVFEALIATSPVVVHQQTGATPATGDAVSNDYQIQIPFVTPDQYSTTLDYIVATQ